MKPTKAEMWLMALGAALVRDNPEAAWVVADVMIEFERRRKKRKPKRRAKR